MTSQFLTAMELLGDLAERGIELQAHGDGLRYRPRAVASTDVLQRLTLHKADLLALLRHDDAARAHCAAVIHQARVLGDAPLAEAMTEALEERVAICVADSIPLAQAERVALVQLRAMAENPRMTQT